MPDSDNKRRGAGNIPGWHIIYPVPDGLIDDADRMQATGFYPFGAGAASSAAPESEVAAVTGGGAIGGGGGGPFLGVQRGDRDPGEGLGPVW